MNLNIRTKLLLFFALTALPMIAIGVLSYFNSVGAIEAVVEQRTLKAMRELAAEVEQPLTRRRGEVALLAHNQDIQDLYARRKTEGAEALERMQERLSTAFRQFFSGQREAFAQVFYLTPEGELIFKYSRTPESATSTRTELALEGYTLALADSAFRGFDPRPLQGEDRLFLFNENTPDYGPILRLGRWVKNPVGQKVGFVLADLEVERLLQESRHAASFEQNEFPVLIERDHDRLLSHPAPSLVGELVDRALPSFALVYPGTSAKEGTAHFKNKGEEWLVSYVNLENVRWTFALLSPLSQSTAAVRQAGLLNLGIIFAAVLLALALSPFVIGRITSSIRQLTAGAEAIAAGDLDQEIQVRTRDETRTLADAFNRMARSLKTTLGDLHQLTEDLEERVQQRTAELEAANQALTAANRQIQTANQLKSDFLARMSHDLRTPMNAIIGYTRILQRRAREVLDQRQYRNLENIQVSADHLLILINDILDLAKIEAGRIDIQPEEVDLKQIATQCALSVESLLKPGVRLEQHLADVAPLYTDPDRLRRVLMNLLSNAVKFTEAGRITVSMQAVEGEVEVSVADTGMGIPPEDLPHIFDEFHQVDRPGGSAGEGTGLGLAIANKSVELLGGKIGAESEVGKGTTFTLRIPDYSD